MSPDASQNAAHQDGARQEAAHQEAAHHDGAVAAAAASTLEPTPTRRERRLGAWLRRQVFQVVIAVALLFGAMKGASWLVATKPTTERGAVTEPVFAVDAMRTQADRLTPSISVFGSVVARRSVELRSLVDGQVINVHPNLMIGEQVPQGAALVSIDPFTYEGAVTEAEANLLEAQARLAESEALLRSSEQEFARAQEQLTLAERDLVRTEALIRRGVANERTLDDRKLILSQRQQAVEAQSSAIAVQRARVDQQRAAIDRLEWRLRDARRDLTDTVLRAPFDAVVRAEFVEPGRRVGVNDVVAELYEVDALDVRFTVSNAEFGRLQRADTPLIGKEAEVLWRVGDEPLRARAVIDRVGSDVLAERGGVELIARIIEADGVIRPGAFVTVALEGRRVDTAIRAPETALYNGDHVFMILPEVDRPVDVMAWPEGVVRIGPAIDGRLRRRAVRVLAWEGDTVILRVALPRRAAILTTRLAEAGDGVAVRTLTMADGAGSAETAAATPAAPTPGRPLDEGVVGATAAAPAQATRVAPVR